ncbi:MAG: hypothetical protein MUF01_15055 [Bryobacterales bacterium]|jgi:hypothetical protein|nr:hypothetical protein [Bryobacterales bacterium]
MLTRLFLLTSLFCSLLVSTLGAQYSVKPEPAMPQDLPAALKGRLQPEGQSIFQDDKKLMSLFFVSSIPAGANSELNVTHQDIAHGTLLAVAHFPADYVDRRGNAIQAGSYYLRLSFFPVNGAHQGIEPQRDFLILTKPSIDADVAAQPSYADLMEMAIKSASVQHPLALSCWKNDYDQANGLVKEGEDDHPTWVLYTDIAGKKMAIIVVGVHTEG